MLPNLKPGHIVIALKLRGKLKRGDLIIFKHNVEKIKRVERILPTGVYVLGDNNQTSTDSRHFGLVNYEDIIGKVITF